MKLAWNIFTFTAMVIMFVYGLWHALIKDVTIMTQNITIEDQIEELNACRDLNQRLLTNGKKYYGTTQN